MSLTALDLALYAGAMLVLFITPGPVWVALMARALSGGFAQAWPLAVGVVIGDLLWPLLALLGMSLVVAQVGWLLDALKWVAAVLFVGLGVALWRRPAAALSADSRLTRQGRWAGFVAGLAVIIGNPKAVFFYMGILPGFFDLPRLTSLDIAAIVVLSGAIPLTGNLLIAAFVGRLRDTLASPQALLRMNRVAGALLLAVGLIIPLV